MLKKLSLAALVAMGSMSVASATDLSEAIKGVDLKGYMRLRAYYESDKDANTDKAGTQSTRWRTTAAFNFTVPVSEDVKFHSDFAFDWNMYNDAQQDGAAQPTNTHMFVDASKNGANLKIGKIPVVTPVTGKGVGEALGAGAIAAYKVNDSLTVAAAGLDTLANTDKVTVAGKNTVAAAAIYKSDVADVQAWYFNVEDLIDSDVVLSADIKALKDSGIKIHVDYAQAELSDKAGATMTANEDTIPAGLKADKTQTYLNVNASFKKDKVCAKLGYAVTGKDGGVVVLDGDASIASVLGTEQQTGIADTTDNNAVYAKVGYNVDKKTNVFVAYSTIDEKSSNEVLVGAKYKYTKKFGVYAYYSVLDQSSKGQDNNEARVEFKYTF